MDNFDKIKRKEKTKEHVGDRIIKTKTTYEPQGSGEVKVTKKTINRPDWNTSHVSSIFGIDRTRKKEIYYQSPNDEYNKKTENKNSENELDNTDKFDRIEMQKQKEKEKREWEEKQNKIKEFSPEYIYKKTGEGKVERVPKQKNESN